MDSVLIGLAGLCLGVLATHCRIPRLRLLPMACSLVLAGIGFIAMIQLSSGSLLNGLLFAFSTVFAACIYGATLWKQHGLGESFSFGQLTWMSAFRPGYLRAAYKGATEGSNVEPRKPVMP